MIIVLIIIHGKIVYPLTFGWRTSPSSGPTFFLCEPNPSSSRYTKTVLNNSCNSNDVYHRFRKVHIINNTMQIVTAELLASGVVADIFPS